MLFVLLNGVFEAEVEFRQKKSLSSRSKKLKQRKQHGDGKYQ